MFTALKHIAVVPLVAASLTADPGVRLSSCESIKVAPGRHVTSGLRTALREASKHPTPGVFGPSGKPQGRVYLRPGHYWFAPTAMPSNVRIEIAPGATLHPEEGTNYEDGGRDWGLLEFGDLTAPARNVSLVAGNGCGGTGTPTAANKPANTDWRGNNDEDDGMANAPVPMNSRWNTDAMWVMDLDPKFNNVGVNVVGLMFRWAYDVEVADVFTIQNAGRLPGRNIGPVEHETSRTTAMMFDPPNDAPFVEEVEDQRLPHRIHVRRHYNILSPSGQGPNQVRACRECTFDDIFSHGGVALRIETDGIRPIGPDCSDTGPDGEGFREFAIVDDLVADDIEGAYGNRTVMLTPHCLPNGDVTISDVRGLEQGELAIAVDGERDSQGGFASASITNVTGCGGQQAQTPYPKQNSYLLDPSRAALGITGSYAAMRGNLAWPAPPHPRGLPDGELPPGDYTLSHPRNCPTD